MQDIKFQKMDVFVNADQDAQLASANGRAVSVVHVTNAFNVSRAVNALKLAYVVKVANSVPVNFVRLVHDGNVVKVAFDSKSVGIVLLCVVLVAKINHFYVCIFLKD